jgi:hypothetical protein
MTLSQRHNRRARSNAEEARQQQLLSPQQEDELVKYIERCRQWGLPHGPVLFTLGFIPCLLLRTFPLGLVRAPFSI